MIKDSRSNIKWYKGLSANMDLALEYLKEIGNDSFQEQRVDLKGDEVFALYQTYETKDIAEAKIETHEKYIDIQYMLSGEEIIRVADRAELRDSGGYSDEEDIEFWAMDSKGMDVVLKPGDFTVLFPQDGHAPRLNSGAPGTVRKVVIKVAV